MKWVNGLSFGNFCSPLCSPAEVGKAPENFRRERTPTIIFLLTFLYILSGKCQFALTGPNLVGGTSLLPSISPPACGGESRCKIPTLRKMTIENVVLQKAPAPRFGVVALISAALLGEALIGSPHAGATEKPISKDSAQSKAVAVKEGASLFRANCSPCHGLSARGGRQTVWAQFPVQRFSRWMD
jgi:hypothetical protein